MAGLSDGDIVKGFFDPKNWGCGKTAIPVLLVVLAGVTAGLVAAAHTVTGYL